MNCPNKLGGRFGQGADSASRKTQLHPTNTLGLKVDRKRAPGVTLGMADFVTGLSTSTGELADAAHSCKNWRCLIEK